jgi:hypothetical protein
MRIVVRRWIEHAGKRANYGEGVVLGPSRFEHCLKVKFDKRKAPEDIHKDFIRPVVPTT